MTQKILVTYASRSGSTAEVATAIGQRFLENGVIVDLLPISQVTNPAAYQAVIVGSAIRNSKWLPEAIQFVRTHQSLLRHRPFAMFTVCITLARAGGEQYRSTVAAWTAPVRRIAAPLSEGIFAGRLDSSRLPLCQDAFRFHLAVALGIFPRGDHRDWKAIRAWAESLKPLLLLPT